MSGAACSLRVCTIICALGSLGACVGRPLIALGGDNQPSRVIKIYRCMVPVALIRRVDYAKISDKEIDEMDADKLARFVKRQQRALSQVEVDHNTILEIWAKQGCQ